MTDHAMKPTDIGTSRFAGWPRVAFWGFVLVLLAARVQAVFAESVNWDEFAFLHRAAMSLETGQLMGAGRPGLGTLLLMPFADGCRNAIDALIQARLLWTSIVIASAAAFWLLLRAVLPPSPHRWAALTTGVGLWVLAPAFLRYSIQVRTDQPAILFGLLGGLALVNSRRRTWLATVAGALLGIGFLFTQKLLYVAGLVGVLAIGQLLILGDWRTRRELLRAALAGAAFLLIVVGYRIVTAMTATAPSMLPLAGALNIFDYYRETYGWRLYGAMLPSLIPQFLVATCLVAVTIAWLRDRDRHGAELTTAWLVLLTGIVVLLVHAARFPYFYMVLGLFPAAVGALIIGPALERIGTQTGQRILLAVIWVPLLFLGLRQVRATTTDTQHVQRESLAFVDRSFAPDARGFHAQGAFVCRADPDHFPVRFNQRVVAEFSGDEGAERTQELIREFRSRPVAFLIPSTDAYPREIREFWATRYVLYHGNVHVPGRHISGRAGMTDTFEVIVPGEYVWWSSPQAGARLDVAGMVVEPGGSVVIGETGVYPVSLPEGGDGILVLALRDPPAPDWRGFYRGW